MGIQKKIYYYIKISKNFELSKLLNLLIKKRKIVKVEKNSIQYFKSFLANLRFNFESLDLDISRLKENSLSN